MNNKARLIYTIALYQHRQEAVKQYVGLFSNFKRAYYKLDRLILGMQLRLEQMYN